MVSKNKSKKWTTIQVPVDAGILDDLHVLCDLIEEENEGIGRPWIYQGVKVAVKEAILTRTERLEPEGDKASK